MANKREKESLFSGTWTQIFAATTGTLFAISDGITYGWTAPVIPYLISDKSHIKTTIHEAEWLETIIMIGSLCGLPITIYMVNLFGCKKSLLMAAIVSLIGWITIALADKMIYIYIVRFFFGIAGNMSFVAAPMYVAEIADQKIRGFLSSITYLMMLIGFVVVYSVAPFTPFYVTPVIGAIIVSIQLVTFSFMPESPYFLLMHQQPEKAKKSLQYFRPKRDITMELDEISKGIQRQETEKGRLWDLFIVPSHRKALIIMTVLNVGQHMAAISVILMNLHLILNEAGSVYMETTTVAIVFSVIMLVAAKMASLQVDKYGRKALLIFSCISSSICLLALSIYFNMKYNGYDVTGTSWIPIVSVMIYAAVFKVGLGIVPIIITAEVFSSKLKAMGMTVADSTYVIGGIVSLQLYQWLSPYGFHVPLYVFAISTLFVAAFTYFYIPETKGKTLEEIQIILKGKKYVVEETTKAEEAKMLEA